MLSIVAASSFIPTNSVKGFPLLHIFAYPCSFWSFAQWDAGLSSPFLGTTVSCPALGDIWDGKSCVSGVGTLTSNPFLSC